MTSQDNFAVRFAKHKDELEWLFMELYRVSGRGKSGRSGRRVSHPGRTATLDAAACAKKLSAVIAYDPNYRPNLWKNKEDIETTDARYSAIQIHQ